MERLYSILLDDAIQRKMLRDDFYFFYDHLLAWLKDRHGFDSSAHFSGSRLEQAYLILTEPAPSMRQAIAKANGISCEPERLLPGEIMISLDEGYGKPAEFVKLKTYKPRSR